jgi:hypothetical protein
MMMQSAVCTDQLHGNENTERSSASNPLTPATLIHPSVSSNPMFRLILPSYPTKPAYMR